MRFSSLLCVLQNHTTGGAVLLALVGEAHQPLTHLKILHFSGCYGPFIGRTDASRDGPLFLWWWDSLLIRRGCAILHSSRCFRAKLERGMSKTQLSVVISTNSCAEWWEMLTQCSGLMDAFNSEKNFLPS